MSNKSHAKIVTDPRDLPAGLVRAASFVKREADLIRTAVGQGKLKGWKFVLDGDAPCRGTVYVKPEDAKVFLREFYERHEEKVPQNLIVPPAPQSLDAKMEAIHSCLLRIEGMLEDFVTRPYKHEDPHQIPLDLSA